MYSEIELESYCIYEEYISNTFGEPTPPIEYFIHKKEKHKNFFNMAKRKIRIEKLKKLNKST